jgi:hypothetical protein
MVSRDEREYGGLDLPVTLQQKNRATRMSLPLLSIGFGEA